MYDGTPGAMSAYSMGENAEAGYAAATQTTATGRSAEARIFSRVIAMLSAAEKKRERDPKDMRPVAEAIHKNNELWIIIASDVSSNGNGLPAGLRAQLFYLAEFSFAHGRKVLAGEAGIGPLIDVNRSVLRGLMGKTVEAEEPAPAQTAGGAR